MAWLGSREAMRAFEERHGLTFPSLYDADGSLFARFGVPSQPAWVFVGADGTAERVTGTLGEDALAERLAGLATG